MPETKTVTICVAQLRDDLDYWMEWLDREGGVVYLRKDHKSEPKAVMIPYDLYQSLKAGTEKHG